MTEPSFSPGHRWAICGHVRVVEKSEPAFGFVYVTFVGHARMVATAELFAHDGPWVYVGPPEDV